MTFLEKAGLATFHKLDPELAHGLAIKALNAGLGPRSGAVSTPRLRTKLAGLSLPNPIGLAAGFDKNATALSALSRTGLAFWKWALPPHARNPAIPNPGCSG